MAEKNAKTTREMVMAGEQGKLRASVENLLGAKAFLNARVEKAGAFLTGAARGRLGDIAKLAPKEVLTLFVQCDLALNPDSQHSEQQPYVVVKSSQLLALVQGKRTLALVDDRLWFKNNSELISRFLAGEDVEVPATADTSDAWKETAQTSQRLQVPMEFMEIISSLMDRIGDLAVVTAEEEAAIKRKIGLLGLDIFSEDDRTLALNLADEARKAIIAEKRRVAIEALRDPLSRLDDDLELPMLDVTVPIITRDGVTYDAAPEEEGVHQIGSPEPVAEPAVSAEPAPPEEPAATALAT